MEGIMEGKRMSSAWRLASYPESNIAQYTRIRRSNCSALYQQIASAKDAEEAVEGGGVLGVDELYMEVGLLEDFMIRRG